MGQTSKRIALATRYATWFDQAEQAHRTLRRLVESAVQVNEPQAGMVTVRIPYADWVAAQTQASRPAPDPEA